jgi:hypothetical protein
LGKKNFFVVVEVISEKFKEKFVIAGEKKIENKFRSARRGFVYFQL